MDGFVTTPSPAAGAAAGRTSKKRRRKAESTMDVQLLQRILVCSQRHAGESHYSLFYVHATTKSSSVYSTKSSQVNTLPKAKSKTRSKQNKDMHKCSSVY